MKSKPTEQHSINEEYQLLECCGCGKPSFRIASYRFEKELNTTVLNSEQYFETKPIRNKPDFIDMLPDTMRNIYFETYKCLINNQPILCMSGIRSMLDLFCQDKGEVEGNLFDKLEKLLNKKIISDGQNKLMHILRKNGNKSIHESDIIPQEKLLSMFDFIDSLLMTEYVIHEKLN